MSTISRIDRAIDRLEVKSEARWIAFQSQFESLDTGLNTQSRRLNGFAEKLTEQSSAVQAAKQSIERQLHEMAAHSDCSGTEARTVFADLLLGINRLSDLLVLAEPSLADTQVRHDPTASASAQPQIDLNLASALSLQLTAAKGASAFLQAFKEGLMASKEAQLLAQRPNTEDCKA